MSEMTSVAQGNGEPACRFSLRRELAVTIMAV
jgi:hypothetical protein